MNRSTSKDVVAVIGFMAVAAASAGGLRRKSGSQSRDADIHPETWHLSAADELTAARELNLGSVRKGLSCFSKADREWFENNYRDYPLDELTGNVAMAISQPVARAGFVFMYGVVPHGPLGLENRLISSPNPTPRPYSFDDTRTIPLVKEGPNWQIKGLFGAKAA